MLLAAGGAGMASTVDDDMNFIQLAQRHHIVVRKLGAEIDLELGPGDDDPSFPHNSFPGIPSAKEHSENKHEMDSQPPGKDQEVSKAQTGKRKKKVVKRWREEWADTYKWACVDIKDETTRIFCSVCREYGRKHRRNPYGNEGSRNMQMSALEEHNNSLLHKEALRLQQASKETIIIDKPGYVKALMSKTARSIVEAGLRRDPFETEFLQSVQEVIHALERVISKNSNYMNTMERLFEPENTIIFRVPWIDDRGETHVNRGYRVYFNQALGPCRGGLRFHPSMNLSIAKFLSLEQTLKNALSPYRLGGSSGGSDFDLKGKSDNEIMNFCQSFMSVLYRYLGPDKDLPSEEMGVGTREMGYLYGQYRRLASHSQGSFTGPRLNWSGSSLRTEATGYGLVFFAQLMLADMNRELKGLRCVVSGSGKIAMHVVEKLIAYGAIPITVSDSKGYLVDEDGFDFMKISFLRNIKAQHRSLRDYSKTYPHSKFYDEAKPWNERCDVVFPCASQNEIDESGAVYLVKSGCRILVEGSKMPCTPEAVDVLRNANVLVAPSIAAGVGGIVAGELELEDCNLNWSPEDFESKLQEAMRQTYQRALKAATDFGYKKESPESATICLLLLACKNGPFLSCFISTQPSFGLSMVAFFHLSTIC